MRPLFDVMHELDKDWQISIIDGDIVTDIIVIARVIRLDSEPGKSTIVNVSSDHTDGIVASGMLHIATRIIESGWD